eukprot:TRINITY_DN36733_c0_g1_i1.p1 TRINITY_DN36733_c0_g1~~TRINITY_DN36733_c0_g1_i1.p1  ORF type:complete len:405 (+),score=56.81 TRINITY_DN36733_c0_g1_i1:71-1216(+)
MLRSLVGSEMCIRDRYQRRVRDDQFVEWTAPADSQIEPNNPSPSTSWSPGPHTLSPSTTGSCLSAHIGTGARIGQTSTSAAPAARMGAAAHDPTAMEGPATDRTGHRATRNRPPAPDLRTQLWHLTSGLGIGVVSGCVVTCLLNPWDRALFLSVAHRRPFLNRANFERPYQGIWQTFFQRSLSSGLYFALEDNMRLVFSSNLLAGISAGVVCGSVLSPLALMKYQLWGHPDESRSIPRQFRSNLRHGGPAVFFRGLPATCIRDMLFGAVFTSLRNMKSEPGEKTSFLLNCVAAALATTVSSPFNFFRNIQFAVTPSKKGKTMREIGIKLLREIQGKQSTWEGAAHLQSKLRIGWGTGRVAIGMGMVSQCYEYLSMYNERGS